MFKQILISTDGSKLAAKGIRAGVKLAKALGARVTGVYVIATYMPPPTYGDGSLYIQGVSPKASKKYTENAARKALAVVEIETETSRVPATTRSLVDTQPWLGILKTAPARNCDAIVNASHGRGGLGGLILGSETIRVLANSKIPVLVIR